eukprot:TRINITY_DN13743_c0_g1_i1.p1 TRINITY_DN13743_c0_g1~~TRINITY_DN13743_c0_g1_i1.p1  ORF type:complete len:684 (+),score=142.96 TRINITY_DN13743_c0_g1_i1:308-2053(+)
MEDEAVPVVLQVQLRRTLHEYVENASREQLLKAMHRVIRSKLIPMAEQHMEQLQNQSFVFLRQTFGSGFDFPTNFRHNLQLHFRDSLLESMDSIVLAQLDRSAPLQDLHRMGHAAVRRFNRRDRILLGKELQQLGVQESVFEAPFPLFAWFNILQFLEIGDLLSSVCRVSRAWFKACTHDKLWATFTRIKFSAGLPPVADIPHFIKKLRNVNEFHFSSTSGSDFILEQVWQFCPMVKVVELPECHIVSDRGLGFVAKIERLQILNLESCEQITNAGIEVLAASCPDLQELNLKYCRNVNNTGIEFLASGCRALKRLNLNYLPITDAALEALSRGCPQIVELSLKYCRNVTDAGVVVLLTACHDLKSLTLSYCHQITNTVLRQLGASCYQLEDLNVKYCREITDDGLESLAQGCRQLADLNVNYCENITDAGLRALADGCHQLKALKIVYCRKVSDNGIAAISAGCHQLTALMADSCPLLTDESLRFLAEGCHLLNKLNLDSCLRLSDQGLEYLSVGCKELVKLNFNACELISDNGVNSLVEQRGQMSGVPCAKLKQVTLTNCPQVSLSCLKKLSALGIKTS